jgi:acyl dehydratase
VPTAAKKLPRGQCYNSGVGPLGIILTLLSAAPQATFNVRELAEYRLTGPVFRQFAHASRLIAAAEGEDARLAQDPLFTREVSVLDDVVASAERVEARLKFEPRYAAALRVAGISAREYTKFALALFGARLAHGFLKSGAIRGVAKGVASDNVAFVAEHEREVSATLHALGVEASPPGAF